MEKLEENFKDYLISINNQAVELYDNYSMDWDEVRAELVNRGIKQTLVDEVIDLLIKQQRRKAKRIAVQWIIFGIILFSISLTIIIAFQGVPSKHVAIAFISGILLTAYGISKLQGSSDN